MFKFEIKISLFPKTELAIFGLMWYLSILYWVNGLTFFRMIFYIQCIIKKISLLRRGRCGRDRMVVGFTCAISTYMYNH